MRLLFIAIATMLTFTQPISAELCNLLNLKEDFVLETKKIVIPGFPKAFNPSIISWHGRLLMSFRSYHPITRSTDGIYLVWLDEDYNPISKPTLLKREGELSCIPSKAQDPRLIVVNDQIYIVYSNLYPEPTSARRMVIGLIEEEEDHSFKVSSPSPLLNFYGEIAGRKEKNWVPFAHENSLYLAYSIQPHRIFVPSIELNGYLPSTEQNSCVYVGSSIGTMKWNWGTLMGGTPALQIGDSYLAFFHSNKALPTVQSGGKIMNHYFMGAYTFKAHHPFAITGISPQPIVAKTFYEGEMYENDTWKPLRVVFPGGFVMDEQFIWIVYGRQDHESWVVKLDKAKLLASLLPVTTVKKTTKEVAP